MSAAPRRPEDRQSTGPCLCSDTSGNLALTRQPCGWKPLARRAPPAVVHPPASPSPRVAASSSPLPLGVSLSPTCQRQVNLSRLPPTSCQPPAISFASKRPKAFALLVLSLSNDAPCPACPEPVEGCPLLIALPSPAKRGPISLLDTPREMPYSGTVGTDPALKSPSTRLRPQRFSSTEFWRRLRAAKTLKSLGAQVR